MGANPIQEKERIVALDIVRGLAILGIFLVNMPSFFAPVIYTNPMEYWTEAKDIFVFNAVDIFAQASFYTLFSFLFGYGFIIFTNRIAEKGLSVPKYFTRRLLVLLIIGVIHAFFVWHGDILITYAICGFALLLARNMSAKAMVWTGTAIIAVQVTLISLLLLVSQKLMGDFDPYAGMEMLIKQSLEVYANGTFMEITKQRIYDWSYVNISGFIFILVSIIPMFFLGAAAAKAQWLTKVEEKLSIMKKLWITTFLLAVIFKLLPYYTEKNFVTEYLQDGIGGPASAIFYFLTVVLATRTNVGIKVLSPLQYVGKMSLSNYLLQSIVFSIVFYGYGFGLYGQFTPFYGLLVVIGFFTLQVIISKIWVARFYYGPAEWLWRAGTYRIWPKLKKM
ncbi:hypothetical protein FIU87_06655 [Bacillus sp. THAF10]|nr:hypothetical protein FIU87_06655 [Bacillus sp. THAF10]